MILEGIVTTQNAVGELNVAPMGPIVDDDNAPSSGVNEWAGFVLRPFQTSTTYRNLTVHPYGVLHVVDDVLLLAEAAIGRPPAPPTFEAIAVPARVLCDACRWYEFAVAELDDTHERTAIRCEVRHEGRLRDFFGFNRARHAVIEAAILATRLHLLPAAQIRAQLASLRSPVEKTAGARETRAFQLLCDFVERELCERDVGGPSE